MNLGYLWSMASGTYKMYDASTGALLATMAQSTCWNDGGYRIQAQDLAESAPAPYVTKAAITVSAGTLVEQEPISTVVGENIGGAGGGGAMLVYIYGHTTGAATGWLACWNSTLAINAYNQDPTVWNFQSAGDFPSITSQLTTPLDWEFGIMWNITVPLTSITGSSLSGAVTSAPGAWSIAGADGKYVILTTW